MEKFTLLILCCRFFLIGANDCIPNMAPCSDVHDIATITCGTVGAECEIKCGPTEVDCPQDGLLAGLLGEEGNKIKTIDAVTCKEMCRQQATPPGVAADPPDPAETVCEFYRWEEEKEGKCILQTNCGKPDMWCQTLDEPRCITGQIGCTEDGTTACSLDSTVVYDPAKFHLICHGGTGDINIYSPDDIKEIDTGTECYTIHMCSEWKDVDGASPLPKYYRKLAVKCSVEGIFEAMAETGDDALSANMIQGKTLVEPTCPSECQSLALDKDVINEKGTELICDIPLVGGVTLEDGNSCILLCDNHFAMSISCQFEHDGTKIWKDENRVEVTTEKVTCSGMLSSYLPIH